jgi:hypothetical protein
LLTITETYSSVQINHADQYGGAGGTSNYAVAFHGTPYTLSLSAGVNYFGLWASAVDTTSTLTFYSNGIPVGVSDGAEWTAAVSHNRAYFGNPNPPFLGDDPSEAFVFINFIDETGSFNSIGFSETSPCCGFESDNQTIGHFSIPEPATGTLMLVGIAGTALAMRRRPTTGAANNSRWTARSHGAR